MKILIVAGGTGGHIYPAIPVANKLKNKDHKVLWAGSDIRMEKDLIEGIEFYGFNIINKYQSKLWFLKNIKELIHIYKFMKEESIDCIFTTGGYISFYYLLAALFLKIDYFMFEPNYIPGKVTKLMYKKAKKVFVTYKETKQILKKNNIQITGTPIRKKFKEKKEDNYLLIFGGSQGAKKINDTVLDLINNKYFKKNKIKIIWITGKKDYKRVKNRLNKTDENIKIFDYRKDMHNVYINSIAALTRGGALTVAELIATNTPSVIIPFPHHKDKHQYKNSKKLLRNNGAIIIDENDERFEKKIKDSLLKIYKEQNEIMRDNIAEINTKNSTDIIVKELLK